MSNKKSSSPLTQLLDFTGNRMRIEDPYSASAMTNLDILQLQWRLLHWVSLFENIYAKLTFLCWHWGTTVRVVVVFRGLFTSQFETQSSTLTWTPKSWGYPVLRARFYSKYFTKPAFSKYTTQAAMWQADVLTITLSWMYKPHIFSKLKTNGCESACIQWCKVHKNGSLFQKALNEFPSWKFQKNNILLYCIVLYCIVLYCIVLYCIVLYCIVLYCIVY